MDGQLIKRRGHNSSIRRERIERTLKAMRVHGLIGKPGVMLMVAGHFGVTRQHIWKVGVDAGILGKGVRPAESGAISQERQVERRHSA